MYFGLSTTETALSAAVILCLLLVIMGMLRLNRAIKRYNQAQREYYERMGQ